MTLISRVFLAVVLSLFAGLSLAQTTDAQEQQKRQVTQPGNNAPMWREVRKEGNRARYSAEGLNSSVGMPMDELA